ncbi:flagellar hook-length control protein FliK [Zobellella sp. DQSA1]|uniref:flagellar hook-length control protein FliK n=1 Tax=Zobellella sp. DQSA1 TaxID=3342386 RepID=UPI0035C17986
MTISISPIFPLAGQGLLAIGETGAGSRHTFAEVLEEQPPVGMTGEAEAFVEPLPGVASPTEREQEQALPGGENAEKAECDAPAVGAFSGPAVTAGPEAVPHMSVLAPASVEAVPLTDEEPALSPDGPSRPRSGEVPVTGNNMSSEWLVQIEHGKRWQQTAAENGGNKLPPLAEPPRPVSDQELAEATASTVNERRAMADGREPALSAGGHRAAAPAASELRTLPAGKEPALAAGGSQAEPAASELRTLPAGKEPVVAAGGSQAEPAASELRTLPAGKEPVVAAGGSQAEPAASELRTLPAGKEPVLAAGGSQAEPAASELRTLPAGKEPVLAAGGSQAEPAASELRTLPAGKEPVLAAGGSQAEPAASELRTLPAGKEPVLAAAGSQAEPADGEPADEEPATASATDDLRGLAGGKESAVLASADIATAQDTLPGGSLFQRDGQLQVTAERPVQPERALTLQGAPEQGARQLAQQVQIMVNQNLQEADIRLSPSDLGGLRIQLRMEQGEVHVQFLASQPQARELLEQALPRLREMLVQQGLNLGQGLVGGFGGQQGSQQQSASASPSPRAASDGVKDGTEPAATDWKPVQAPWQAINGRIDFFA